jgi:hypothetical protein
MSTRIAEELVWQQDDSSVGNKNSNSTRSTFYEIARHVTRDTADDPRPAGRDGRLRSSRARWSDHEGGLRNGNRTYSD